LAGACSIGNGIAKSANLTPYLKEDVLTYADLSFILMSIAEVEKRGDN
jgi:hypothetical protein